MNHLQVMMRTNQNLHSYMMGPNGLPPTPTSGETDSGTQGFSVRYVQPLKNLINMDKNLKHYVTL